MTVDQGKLGVLGTEADMLAALKKFVVDEDDDLLALESLIGRFNIFDALGIKDVEIRHSNFLAFLLDPAESHGQGQLFLQAILMDLLKKAPPELRPLSPIDLDGTDLRGVEIRREWKHIDIFMKCKEPCFFVVIENKIRAKEAPGSLSRYEKAMQHHYPDARPLYVYLTLDGDEPSEDKWMTYSHADIYRVLERVRKTYRKAIGEDVLLFLDHYLNLIGTRFMSETADSKRFDELCQRIYTKHRLALDLIRERVGTPTSGQLAEAKEVLEEDPRWHMVPCGSNRVNFVPAT
jgi:PD-(D/E)XK nuclease superfamily